MRTVPGERQWDRAYYYETAEFGETFGYACVEYRSSEGLNRTEYCILKHRDCGYMVCATTWASGEPPEKIAGDGLVKHFSSTLAGAKEWLAESVRRHITIKKATLVAMLDEALSPVFAVGEELEVVDYAARTFHDVRTQYLSGKLNRVVESCDLSVLFG